MGGKSHSNVVFVMPFLLQSQIHEGKEPFKRIKNGMQKNVHIVKKHFILELIIMNM
jgi:hypothetical protein